MKKFQFKLEKLLRLREWQEEEEKNALAKVIGKYNAEEQAIADYQRRLEENSAKVDNLPEEDAIALLDNITMFESALRAGIETHRKNMASLEKDIEKARISLAEAVKQRRVVEIVKEKQMEAYKKELLLEEQKNIDDRRFIKERQEKTRDDEYTGVPRTILEKRARMAKQQHF